MFEHIASLKAEQHTDTYSQFCMCMFMWHVEQNMKMTLPFCFGLPHISPLDSQVVKMWLFVLALPVDILWLPCVCSMLSKAVPPHEQSKQLSHSVVICARAVV